MNMEFGAAIVTMREGHRVTRAGWTPTGIWVALQVPDANSKMTRPYLYVGDAAGDRAPYNPTQSDMLAADWEIAQ